MRKLRKDLKTGLCAAAFAVICIVFTGQADVLAAETSNADTVIEAQETVVGDAVKQEVRQAGTYALITPNGEVIGTGVRLRSKPSLNAPVLELMYYGEEVIVVTSQTTTNNNGTWYYVKRTETGTWGWASADYIVCWDI